MTAIVNLTALSEARAKMTPGEYELAEQSPESEEGALHIVACDRPALIVATMTDDYEQEDDGAGLVAEHNAMPVLLEVVRAAKAWASATTDIDDVAAAWSALQAALAKVSL